MSTVTRANPYLNEIIEILDMHRRKYKSDAEAINKLPTSDQQWIDEELTRCMVETRYFISNYFFYRDESEGFRGLYPFFDSQEILHDKYREFEKLYGKVRAIVLKARQMGATTYNIAEFFHKTIFWEHTNSMLVSQDEKGANYNMGMYESAFDYLPWWMKPRVNLHQTGVLYNFDEPDESMRDVRPGLKSSVFSDNANRPSGVGRGQTFRRGLMDELAFWRNSSQLSKALLRAMNAADGFYVMMSTANGRNNAFHNLWRRAERNEIDWHPIFIPFYRRDKTYSLPILKDEVFTLTEDEEKMRAQIVAKENFRITDETFKWMRKTKEEFIATDGDDAMFSQEYTSEPEESFQSSAITAFPRRIIHRFSKMTTPPRWVGEIGYDQAASRERLNLREWPEVVDIPYPDNNTFRFHVWKKPVPGAKYSMGVDVALGNENSDYSCVQVIRLSEGIEPDEQVACWHGLINPTALAGIVAAVGYWYNEALAAVEVNSYGEGTNFILMRQYEYENVYRFKRLDRITNFITNISGWLSTSKSTDSLMAKMSEAFLEDSIIINCKWTMDEFNDYTEEGARGRGAHDDMVDALLIALFCGHEGEVKARQEGRSTRRKEDQDRYFVHDRWGTKVDNMDGYESATEAERVAKKYPGSTVIKVGGAAAMVELAGMRHKVPATEQNTAHSPIHDDEGSVGHRLHYDEGIAAEEITPEMEREFAEELEDAENSPDAWMYQ